MAALATVADLFTLLGKPLPANDSIPYLRAQLLLELASDWARDFAKKTWLSPAPVPPTVRGLVLAGAKREYVNPRRVTYEVKGPESASYDRLAYPPGFFTPAEEQYLQKFCATGSLWTQGTFREYDDEINDGYLEIVPGGGWMKVYAGTDPGAEDAYHV